MTQTFSHRFITLLTALLLALVSGPVRSAQGAESSACVDRVDEAASAALPARLPSLRYRCMSLRDGQAVLIGQAGAADRQTVLLVHGLGHNAHRDWASVIPVLAARFHVVVLDLPGFGSSPAPPEAYSFAAMSEAIAEVLDTVAPLQRVHVVGHSLGGAVALYFAHRHADQVERLVLVDAAGILLKPVFAHGIASLRLPQVGIAAVDRLLSDVDDGVNDWSRKLIYGLDDRFDFTPWLIANPRVRRALLGEHTQVDAALSLVEHDFSAAIRETLAQTTLIWGRDDPISPLRTGKLLLARMPDARLQVIDAVGHTPMLEKPVAFNRLLLQALTEPWPAKRVLALPTVSQGDVSARNVDKRRYSGRFDSLTLENCSDVLIENAQIKQLKVIASSVTLNDSVIDSADVALDAQGSELTATAVQLRGRVAIRADASVLDLAGVSVQASERGIEMPTPSHVFLSVSDWQGRDYSGDAHFIWPPLAGVKP